MLDAAADGGRWVLVVMLALAAIEKGASLHSRSAAWHPVMLVSSRRRQHAAKLLTISLVADVAAIALLVFDPKIGALASGALILLYTVAAIRVHGEAGGGDCRCFWKFLNVRTRKGLAARNATLLGLTAGVAIGRPVPSVGGLGWAVVVLGLLALLTGLAERGAEARFRAESLVPRGSGIDAAGSASLEGEGEAHGLPAVLEEVHPW